ncbi:MAG: MEDS domain-containing protein, partial [Armatimonadetes bacterium]|nr:MEDS domain-containing protein [Armatimonadota bacterium]
SLLISETEKAVSEGYPALRVSGEMTWILRDDPGSERLIEYESKLNRDLFPKYPCLAVCQYDREKFDPEIIKGVMMTHPLVVYGNRIYQNPFYIPPEEYLGKNVVEYESMTSGFGGMTARACGPLCRRILSTTSGAGSSARSTRSQTSRRGGRGRRH